MTNKILRVISTGDDDEMVLHVPRWGAFDPGSEASCGCKGENTLYLAGLYEVDADWCPKCAQVATLFNAQVTGADPIEVAREHGLDPTEMIVAAWMEQLDYWLEMYQEFDDDYECDVALRITLMLAANVERVPNLNCDNLEGGDK